MFGNLKNKSHFIKEKTAGLNPESLKHLSINNFLLNYLSIDYLIINI